MMQCIKKYRITFRKYKYNDETKGRKKRKKLNKLKYFNCLEIAFMDFLVKKDNSKIKRSLWVGLRQIYYYY